MATTRMDVQTELFTGTLDSVTNTHVRRQIQRLRRLKGWTQQDLEQAAGMSPNSIDGIESGLLRISVETLQSMVGALETDITEVWPSPKRGESLHLNQQGSDPISISRLTEIHSLTGAEASCMFTHLDLAGSVAEVKPGPVLRTLCAINLSDEETELLCHDVLDGIHTAPWVTYRHSENGRTLHLCLKNAHLEFWAEGFVERCLSAWLCAPLI